MLKVAAGALVLERAAEALITPVELAAVTFRDIEVPIALAYWLRPTLGLSRKLCP